MEHNELRRAIVRTAVHKGIREIREDPERGLRKLVDLGAHFSRGCFQKRVYEIMQKHLVHADSAYYKMVMRMIDGIRPEYLEDFGINIGYNSWTYGAKRIRAYEAEHGYNVPWCIVMDLSHGAGFDVDGVMRQGEQLGVYSYFLFGGAKSDVAGLFPVFRKHRDCAVFLMLQNAELPIVNMENVTNVLLLMPAEEQNTPSSADELRARKCCYGLWAYYEEQNVQTILSGEMERRAESMDAAAVFVVPGRGVCENTRSKVQQYAEKMREEKRYMPFLIDFVEDIERIDRVISVESCMLCIESDGTVTTKQGHKPNVSVRNMSLEDVLMCTMPRVNYDAKDFEKE